MRQQLYTPVEIDATGEEMYGMKYAEIKQWQEATRNSADIAFERGDSDILDTPSGAQLIYKETDQRESAADSRRATHAGPGLSAARV